MNASWMIQGRGDAADNTKPS